MMAIADEVRDSTTQLSIDNVIAHAGVHDAVVSKGKAPALPPDVADVKSKTTEQFLREMNKMPLFMTELDETDEEGGLNESLQALKALAYEGEPHEVYTPVGKTYERQVMRCRTDSTKL